MRKSQQERRKKIGITKIMEHQMGVMAEIEFLKQKHNESKEDKKDYATKLYVSKDRYEYYKSLSKDGELLGLTLEINEELKDNQIGLE